MRGLVALVAFALSIAAVLRSWQAADPPARIVDLAPALFEAEGGCQVANIEALRRAAIVYTWVNGSEACYNERRKRAGLSRGGSSRDKEMGELKYSIRSLLKFAPWLEGPIFIVTPGHVPEWLDTNNPRIRVVDQDDLLPKEKPNMAIPTFDTNVIEQYLHKVPGVSDVFIHMNDDYLFVKPVAPHRLFSCDGGLRMLTEINHIRHVPAQKTNAWLASVRNTVQLMDATYGGEHVVNFLKHAPFVYSRQAFNEIHRKFGKELNAMLSHQLRHPEDLNMPLLHHIYMLEEGSRKLGIPVALNPLDEADDWLLVRVRDTEHDELREVFARTLSGRGREVLLALNDEYQNPATAKMVGEFYAKLLPEPTPYELPEGQVTPFLSNYHGPECAYDPDVIPFPQESEVYVAPESSKLRSSVRPSFRYDSVEDEAEKKTVVLSSTRRSSSPYEDTFESEPPSFAWAVSTNMGFVLGLILAALCATYVYRIAERGFVGAFTAGGTHTTKNT